MSLALSLKPSFRVHSEPNTRNINTLTVYFILLHTNRAGARQRGRWGGWGGRLPASGAAGGHAGAAGTHGEFFLQRFIFYIFYIFI
jgi:hypothetical protein